MKIVTTQFTKKTELMLDLLVEALKTLMYLQEDPLKEASKSKFMMSIWLRSKGFKVHIQVKPMTSSQAPNYYYYHHHFYSFYQFIFC